MSHVKDQINKIVIVGLCMALGLLLFKFLPMQIWGSDILFDASMHIVVACWVLYIIWFFVDQNRGWRIPFFILSALVLLIVAVQRIEANAHNDIGLLLGFIIAVLSIAYVERKNLRGTLKF